VYARIAGPIGLLGLVGVVLIALGWMFFGLFLSLFSAMCCRGWPTRRPRSSTPSTRVRG
jgi:hypothetical protein